MPSGLDLRPRTVGELLDSSFTVYRRRFWTLLTAVTLVSLPTLIGAALYAEPAAQAITGYFEWAYSWQQKGSDFDTEQYFAEWMDQYSRLTPMILLTTLFQALSRGGALAIGAMAAWYAVRRLGIPPAWPLVREALPRIPAVILCQFLITQVFGMTVCCLPLYVIVMAMMAPAPAVMMIERGQLETALRGFISRQGPVIGWATRLTLLPLALSFDGIVRSFALSFHAPTVGRGTLFVFFLFMFVTLFVTGVTAAAQGISSLLGATDFATLFWAQHYAEVLVLPVTGIGTALWYLDLRSRREGLDLIPEGAA